MTKDDALKLVDNAKIAEQLSELYGGDWTVTSDFNEDTGELITIEELSGTVETIHCTVKFPPHLLEEALQ